MNTERIFPDIIDNTFRSTFIKCPLKAYNQQILGLNPSTPSIHLHAGGSFARGMEVTRKAFHSAGFIQDEAVGLGAQALIEAYGDYAYPEDHAKAPNRLIEALVAYFDEYPLADDPIQPFFASNGEPAVEFTFCLPLEDERGGHILNPQSGNPLLYAGRFDMLGKFNDTLFVVDEKTCTSLGGTWAGQWEMASQMTGYTWAAREYGYPVAGAIIRGVCLLKCEVKFAQAITYRPEWRIAQWYKQLLHDVRRMIAAWNNNQWDMSLDHACNDFGGCGYRNACLSPEPERWLQDFVVRRWNPLSRAD